MSTFKPRQSIVWLFQGDDLDPIVDRIQNVETVAVNAATYRPGDEIAVTNAAGDYDGFMDEAKARAIQVEIHALGRKQYQALRNEHPVRMVEDPNDPEKKVVHADDVRWGFNYDTFGDALLLAWGDRGQGEDGQPLGEGALSVFRVFSQTEGVAPDVSTRALLEQWLDLLSDTEFSALYSRAVQLNEGNLPDPKVRFSSLLDQTSDGTLESPERLA